MGRGERIRTSGLLVCSFRLCRFRRGPHSERPSSSRPAPIIGPRPCPIERLMLAQRRGRINRPALGYTIPPSGRRAPPGASLERC